MNRSRGVALLEVVIALVVIATAAGAVLAASSLAAVNQSRLYVQQQGLSVANAYLEEIRSRAFSDPDGINGEVARSAFDDVGDYSGLRDVGARDASGAAIPGFNNWTIDVRVVPWALPGLVVAADGRQIEVQATRAGTGTTVIVTGYKVRP